MCSWSPGTGGASLQVTKLTRKMACKANTGQRLTGILGREAAGLVLCLAPMMSQSGIRRGQNREKKEVRAEHLLMMGG